VLLAALATLCLALPAHTSVIDPFRAPPCDRCAGNRGLELATTSGTEVRAATNGTVTFAGLVGGRLYVVLRAQGDRRLRVTYGGLGSLKVSRGRTVMKGESLGIAADALFFGVRIGDRHVDPVPYTRIASTMHTGASATLDAGAAAASAHPRFRVTLGVPPAHGCNG
jgi:murein DD-endopeptidase MepM/ murein hydrolase activator NlpD